MSSDNLGDLLLEELVSMTEPAVTRGAEARVSAPARAANRAEDPSRKSRVGNTLYIAGKPVGSISYLLHWEPASLSARCKIHEKCICTGDINRISEDDLEEWLYQGQRYSTSEAHLQVKPEGCYNTRRRG